jgi:hypothetical protein
LDYYILNNQGLALNKTQPEEIDAELPLNAKVHVSRDNLRLTLREAGMSARGTNTAIEHGEKIYFDDAYPPLLYGIGETAEERIVWGHKIKADRLTMDDITSGADNYPAIMEAVKRNYTSARRHILDLGYEMQMDDDPARWHDAARKSGMGRLAPKQLFQHLLITPGQPLCP